MLPLKNGRFGRKTQSFTGAAIMLIYKLSIIKTLCFFLHLTQLYTHIVLQYMYLATTICTTLPIVRKKCASEPCCEDVVVEPPLPRTR